MFGLAGGGESSGGECGTYLCGGDAARAAPIAEYPGSVKVNSGAMGKQ